MAEAKTKLTGESVTDFLNKVPDEQRRKDCFVVMPVLKKLITKSVAKMAAKRIS